MRRQMFVGSALILLTIIGALVSTLASSPEQVRQKVQKQASTSTIRALEEQIFDDDRNLSSLGVAWCLDNQASAPEAASLSQDQRVFAFEEGAYGTLQGRVSLLGGCQYILQRIMLESQVQAEANAWCQAAAEYPHGTAPDAIFQRGAAAMTALEVFENLPPQNVGFEGRVMGQCPAQRDKLPK